jgi:hypothetical protein
MFASAKGCNIAMNLSSAAAKQLMVIAAKTDLKFGSPESPR